MAQNDKKSLVCFENSYLILYDQISCFCNDFDTLDTAIKGKVYA